MQNPANLAVFPFYKTPWQSVLQITALPNSKIATPFSIRQQRFNLPKLLPVFANFVWQNMESQQVAWLIGYFNHWFAHRDTVLVNGITIGKTEPEYFAKTDNSPAKIIFAHGFFASGLHEISHWCVAGKKRRQLDDFGYWYAPDGRSAAEQANFEQVEIVPQAIECLLTLSCGKNFKVSQDNLFADFDTSKSTFAQAVCEQAIQFWQTGEKLPTDAKILLHKLQRLRPFPLTEREIWQNFHAYTT